MERYDIAIIGTGPAGISAAITAKIRNKNILLAGSRELTKKLKSAHEINNYPGFPAVKGEKLAEAFSEHLKELDIKITETKVTNIYAMGDYFTLQSSKGDYEALSVIVATGVMQDKLLEGEEANVGRGVSYCATCDAALYKGKKVIVAGYDKKDDEEADFLCEVAAEVIYLPVYASDSEDIKLKENAKVIRGEKPVAVSREGKIIRLDTDKESYEADGVFILRQSVSPGQLVPGLVTEGPHIKVDREMKTSIKGLFACGDIAGKPYQYIKSAGEGNVAALSAVSYLAERKKDGK